MSLVKFDLMLDIIKNNMNLIKSIEYIKLIKLTKIKFGRNKSYIWTIQNG